MRTGDNQNGHHALEHEVGCRVAEQRPQHRGESSGNSCHIEQPRGRPVCEQLGLRLRGLSLGHQTHDSGNHGVATNAGHPHGKRALAQIGARAVDCAGNHRVANTLAHLTRLTCDHRLIQLARAIDNLAIGRNRAARANQNQVANLEQSRCHALDFITLN